MVEVKICGLCRPEDAALAQAACATWGGVILAPGRSRTRTLSQAADIFAAAPGLKRVLVFVDATVEEMLHAGDVLAADVLQLHGSEPAETLRALRAAGAPALWKAVRADTVEGAARGLAAYDDVAHAILLDGGTGGAGTTFDWESVATLRRERAYRAKLVLAGGLSPDNVASGIEKLHPDIVDVSSGVEARPGEKDAALVHAFVRAARG